MSGYASLIKKDEPFLHLTPGASVDWDLSKITNAKLILDQNTTINLINQIDGRPHLLQLIQGGVGEYTVIWNTVFWPNGVAPILTIDVGAVDYFSFVSDDARIDGSFWGTDNK